MIRFLLMQSHGALRGALKSTPYRVLMLLAMLVVISAVSFAQTAVPLVVPTNEIFTQTNSWLQTFAPVVAIGVGIAVALAILRFIGKQIIDAF